MAGIVPFIVMKAMALADRMKEKDAWDICFCARATPVALDALADAFRPHVTNRLVNEGLNKIKEKFASPEHVGPTWVADFEEIDEAEARAYRKRDAYERVMGYRSTRQERNKGGRGPEWPTPSAFDLRCLTRSDEVGGKRCFRLHRRVRAKKPIRKPVDCAGSRFAHEGFRIGPHDAHWKGGVKGRRAGTILL